MTLQSTKFYKSISTQQISKLCGFILEKLINLKLIAHISF